MPLGRMSCGFEPLCQKGVEKSVSLPMSPVSMNFQKDYENVKTYRLEQNYRSSKNIVEAANSIIDKNKKVSIMRNSNMMA